MYITILIATSRRLTDQEKKSSEDPYPIDVDCNSSKCNYGISSGESGAMAFEEEYSRQIPPESANNYMPEGIKTKELFDSHWTMNAQPSVYYNCVKSPTMQNDIQYNKNQATESRGEDFIYYVQHAEAPSEELDTSLETSTKTDAFSNFQQPSTVASDEDGPQTLNAPLEPCHSLQMTSLESELASTLQSSNVKLKNQTESLKIPMRKCDKPCHQIELLELDEHLESSHIAYVQKEEPFASPQAEAVQSQDNITSLLASSLQYGIVPSEENVISSMVTSSQPETLQSDELPTHLRPEKLVTSLQPIITQPNKTFTTSQSLINQSIEPVTFPKSVDAWSDKSCTPPHAAVKFKELFTSSHVTASQSQKFLPSSETDTLQSNALLKSSCTRAVQSKDLFTSLATEIFPNDELLTPPHAPTVQSNHHFTSETADFKSNELFMSADAAALQSKDHCTSMHTAAIESHGMKELLMSVHKTIHSEDLMKTSKTATVQSAKLCNNVQMLNPASVKPFNGLKTKKSEWPYISAWTPTDYQEELSRPPHALTVQREEFDDLHPTTSLKSLNSITLKPVPQVQQGTQENQDEFALNDLCLTRQNVSSQSGQLIHSTHGAVVPEKYCQTNSTIGKMDDTGNSGQKPSNIFAETCMKLASTVQSEAIYLSCDSQWSDSVTANKVAVEGDLNG